jgi:hypothetical protein
MNDFGEIGSQRVDMHCMLNVELDMCDETLMNI